MGPVSFVDSRSLVFGGHSQVDLLRFTFRCMLDFLSYASAHACVGCTLLEIIVRMVESPCFFFINYHLACSAVSDKRNHTTRCFQLITNRRADLQPSGFLPDWNLKLYCTRSICCIIFGIPSLENNIHKGHSSVT